MVKARVKSHVGFYGSHAPGAILYVEEAELLRCHHTLELVEEDGGAGSGGGEIISIAPLELVPGEKLHAGETPEGIEAAPIEAGELGEGVSAEEVAEIEEGDGSDEEGEAEEEGAEGAPEAGGEAKPKSKRRRRR